MGHYVALIITYGHNSPLIRRLFTELYRKSVINLPESSIVKDGMKLAPFKTIKLKGND